MIESIDDILASPHVLAGKKPQDVEPVIRQALAAGWKVETLGKGMHRGMGLILRETTGGRLTGRMIQWHPGGGHHGPDPYWKVSSPELGVVRAQG